MFKGRLRLRSSTYAEFEHNNDGEDSPDGVLSNIDIVECIFPEYKQRNNGQCKSHFNGKDDFSGIRATHFPSFNSKMNSVFPKLDQLLAQETETAHVSAAFCFFILVFFEAAA